MTTGEQHDVMAFLSTPAAYGGSSPVERIDTHISVVWLAGDRAYKLKRAVRFDYVDFSTVELRRAACEAEVRLNRRQAPALYVGVRSVTRDAGGSLAIDGRGTPIDWLVEMVRFDQDTLFDRLAERHQLDAGLMEGLAGAIADLHAAAKPRPDRGGRRGIAWVVDSNEHGFATDGAAILDPAGCARLSADARAALERHAQHLDARQRSGLVRECHGDLHLRNICLVDGTPTLFDAVEFNENISCIDVLYDVAFLLMDLWHRELWAHANLVFNEYLTRTGDLDGLPLLPLFLSCRAGIRALISATAAKVQSDDDGRIGLETASREYLALAQDLVRPPPACMVAIGGFSGSGKSTLAQRLAPLIGAAPGAHIVRSDTIRKSLLGVSPLVRLGADGYSDDMTRRVYETMAGRASSALAGGHSVIADAVFGKSDDRDAIEAMARDAGVPFVGLWIEAPREILAARLAERVGDVSDATVDVLDRQLGAGVGSVGWNRLDGSRDPESIGRSAEGLLIGRCRRVSPRSGQEPPRAGLFPPAG
jgi:aminoglycoside phosphotransferase family enzyme/predicted kinase